MMVGLVPIAPGLDLGIIGAPGCTLNQQIEVLDVLTATAGSATWSLSIANNPTWLGLSLYHQVLSIDPTANALGATTSNAGVAGVGM